MLEYGRNAMQKLSRPLANFLRVSGLGIDKYAHENRKLGMQRFCTSLASMHQCFDIKQAPDKGLGLFAKSDVTQYSLVIDDPSLLCLRSNEDLIEAFDQYQVLSDDDQARLRSLHHLTHEERDDVLRTKLKKRGVSGKKLNNMIEISSIFIANAFKVNDTGDVAGFKRALFPNISRINHSCLPNAHTYYDPNNNHMVCHALMDVSWPEFVQSPRLSEIRS